MLALILLSVSLCACLSNRLPSAHATAADRIKRLEKKAEELDDRTASRKSLAPSNDEESDANKKARTFFQN